MRVVLHDQEFSDTGTPDAEGVTWMVTEIDGWSSPPVRTTALEKTYAHGSVPALVAYGPRPVTLKGVVKSPTEALFWQSYNRLNTITNNLKAARALSVEEDVMKTLFVTKAAEVRQSFVGLGAITFEIPLMAYDPLKYGDPVTVSVAAGGSRIITHDGNEASPFLTASLNGTGTLSLLNEATGQTVTSGSNGLEAGTEVDFRARTVYWSGADRYSRLHPTSSWWKLAPDTNRIVNSGSTGVSITYRPAWV